MPKTKPKSPNKDFQRIVARVLILSKDGYVLYLKRAPYRKNARLWDFAGGGVNRRETPKKAAKRETKEETGWLPKKLKKVGQTEKHNRISILFLAVVDKRFKPELDDEHTKHRWEKRSTKRLVKKGMHPSTRKLLESSLDKIAELRQ